MTEKESRHFLFPFSITSPRYQSSFDFCHYRSAWPVFSLSKRKHSTHNFRILFSSLRCFEIHLGYLLSLHLVGTAEELFKHFYFHTPASHTLHILEILSDTGPVLASTQSSSCATFVHME